MDEGCLTPPCLPSSPLSVFYCIVLYIGLPEDRGVASLSVTFCVCQRGKQGVKQIYPSVKSKKAPQWAPEGVVGNQAHIN